MCRINPLFWIFRLSSDDNGCKVRAYFSAVAVLAMPCLAGFGDWLPRQILRERGLVGRRRSRPISDARNPMAAGLSAAEFSEGVET